VSSKFNKERKLRGAVLIGRDAENDKQDANTSSNSAVYNTAVTLYACKNAKLFHSMQEAFF
jgi:hypothetical protein